MPFDGTSALSSVETAVRPKPVTFRSRKPVKLVAWAVVFAVAFPVYGELYFPDCGPLTLLVEGPTVVRQNYIAHEIKDHAKQLQFNVGSHRYTVLSPSHALSSDEQTAWLGFSQRKHYPVYSVDGPSAIDP